jgi:hypothetical protein
MSKSAMQFQKKTRIKAGPSHKEDGSQLAAINAPKAAW